ncbi:eCIS core domain-containing protein [Cyclobacterium jeungdonense]|uniref:DUF4157 domain-containing protein n=1 Tax=Cyclobacterium jeungdonense TaxID=708087 RepID=A0ABT8CEF6_9BACT|nr:DUF4157 domain-containing protein [Cyclobacterium jeungdonense]MDN3689968.1 DUF4157 domain-containing protein [Cyclobacterium jeungdonense]
MKKAVYRKSSVGVMNPFFHHRKDNPFFSSGNMGSEQIIASKEEESSENLLQKQPEEQETEDNLQMTQSDEEQVQMIESDEEQVMSQTEEEVQMQEEEESLQTKADQKASDASRQRNAEKIEPLLRLEKGRGRLLEADTRESMERAFRADFGAVRVHTNASSQLMNKIMHAHAFTYGNDIFFNENNYQPETKAGKHLLAHELTHTIQQKGLKSKNLQGHWRKSERYQAIDKGTIRAAIHLRFDGAVWNKSSNMGMNTTGLATAAKSQIENSFKGSIEKEVMGITIQYQVTTTASIRAISKLTDLQLGKEHLLVVLDDSHPKVKGLYGKGPFYGTIVYLNEKYIVDIISGADVNTIPHEVGHTAGLKHLIEKGEEKSLLGVLIKDLHHQSNPDNIMWRGGGHPGYTSAEADSKLVKTNEEQLDNIYQNIENKKVNQLDLFSLVDLYSLEK